jgi:hypothetical protein
MSWDLLRKNLFLAIQYVTYVDLVFCTRQRKQENRPKSHKLFSTDCPQRKITTVHQWQSRYNLCLPKSHLSTDSYFNIVDLIARLQLTLVMLQKENLFICLLYSSWLINDYHPDNFVAVYFLSSIIISQRQSWAQNRYFVNSYL